MDTLYNTTIIETNGVRSIAGGGTGASTASNALKSLLSATNINVGIATGATTPSRALTVNGEFLATGNVYGDNATFTTGTFTTSVTSPSISSTKLFFGTGNQMVLSDGFVTNNAGNGPNTLSLNFNNGVYMGLSGNSSLYALGVPKFYTILSPVPTLLNISVSPLPFFNTLYPTIDYLTPDSVYEIEYSLYFYKNTAGIVTYQLSASNTLNLISSQYYQGPPTGVAAVGNAASAGVLATSKNSVNLPGTVSLTTSVSHNAFIKALVKTSGLASNIVLNVFVNQGGGTLDPLPGSYRKITKIT
jgi:hypothetical protein